MDTDSFIVHIKTDDIYNKDIAENVETRFETWNFELDHCLKEKRKKIVLIKDESSGKIMKKFIGLKEKSYIYLINDDSEDKKA